VSLAVLKMHPSRCSRLFRARQLANCPLWAMATGPFWVSATKGWALVREEEPMVEYRLWPMAARPSSSRSVRSENTSLTMPMP